MEKTRDADATLEPSAGSGDSKTEANTSEQKSDYLSAGRYALRDEDLQSRANVRHLLARSDELERLQSKHTQLLVEHNELKVRFAIIEVKANRNLVMEYFMTFCVSAGFALAGFSGSYLTTQTGRSVLSVGSTAFGLLVAIGALIAQVRSRS